MIRNMGITLFLHYILIKILMSMIYEYIYVNIISQYIILTYLYYFRVIYQVLLHVKKSDKITTFVVILNQYYQFRRIVSVEMGYKNARLMGHLPGLWIEKLNIELGLSSKKANTNTTDSKSVNRSDIETNTSSQCTTTDSSENETNIPIVYEEKSSQKTNTTITTITTNTSNTTQTKPVSFKDMFITRNILLINDKIMEQCNTLSRDTTDIPFKTKTNNYSKYYNLSECDGYLIRHLLLHKKLYVYSSYQLCHINLVGTTEQVSTVIMNGSGNLVKSFSKINNEPTINYANDM